MSFNSTVVPSLDMNTEIFPSVQVEQKIFAGNKLIVNAAPLINLVVKLRGKLVPKDVSELKRKLIQEVRVFEDLIADFAYSSEVILKARYGLCVFIDDCLINTPWGTENNWGHNGLLYTFDKESLNTASNHFFAILKEVIGDAANNIDLLELYYIFFTLDFGNRYKVLPNGKNIINKFTEDLYDCIARHRVHFDNTLFQEEIPTIKEKIELKIDYKYVLMSGLIGLLIFCFFYFYLNSNLNSTLEPLVENIQAAIK